MKGFALWKWITWIGLMSMVLMPYGVWAEMPVEPQGANQANNFTIQLSDAFVHEAGTTLVDLDGNGQLEIVVGSRRLNGDGTLGCGGVVYVYNADSTLRWQVNVRAGVNAAPAVADLNGDGVKDVLVGMGAWHDPEVKAEDRYTECGIGNSSLPGNGGVTALNGLNGTELWTFNTQDWGEWGAAPNGDMANGVLDGVYSSPAIGDVNGDGSPEVVFGSFDNCIYLLDHLGNPLWGRVPFDYYNPVTGQDFCGGHGFFNHDTVWSSPALADLTGDGALEIVIGGDISCEVLGDPNRCNQYQVPNGGFMWVIRYDGTPLARRWFDQAIYSSPAVADVENDGVLDIVVGTGQGFANKGYYITAWNLNTTLALTEALVQKWRVDVVGRTFSSPALGDLDGNGILDVVMIIKYGEYGIPVGPAANNGSYVYALRGDTGAELWRTHACNADGIGRSFPINASPTLADITGDNLPETFFPHTWEIAALNPNGTYYSVANTANGCTSTSGSASYSGNGTFSASVAVGDLNNDGTFELVAPGRWNEGSGSLVGSISVWSLPSQGSAPWPMFRQNPPHTGSLLVPSLQVSPSSIVIPFVSGQTPAAQQIVISNGSAGTSFDWSASINWSGSQATNWFTLSAMSGSVSQSAKITLDVSAANTATPGTYQAVITITGEDAENSPQQITVQYVVPPPTLYVNPTQVLFLLAPEDASGQRNVSIANTGGGGAIQWTATESLSWLSITPASGSTDTDPHLALTVDSTGMTEGFHNGTVTLQATTAGVTNPDQTVTVVFYFGPLTRVYMPLVLRSH